MKADKENMPSDTLWLCGLMRKKIHKPKSCHTKAKRSTAVKINLIRFFFSLSEHKIETVLSQPRSSDGSKKHSWVISSWTETFNEMWLNVIRNNLAAKRSSTQKVVKEIDRAINFSKHLKFEWALLFIKATRNKMKNIRQSSLSVSEN